MRECRKGAQMLTSCLFVKGWVSKVQTGHGLLSALQRYWRKHESCRSYCTEDIPITSTSCLLLPQTVTLTDPQGREWASQTGINCGYCTWTDGTWPLWAAEERHGRILQGQHSHPAVQADRERQGHSSCKIQLPRRLSLLVAGHPSSEDPCSTSSTSSLFLPRVFISQSDGVITGYVKCRHTHSLENSRECTGCKDVRGQLANCMSIVGHTTSELVSLGTVVSQTPVTIFSGSGSVKVIHFLQTHFGAEQVLRNSLKLSIKAALPL